MSAAVAYRCSRPCAIALLNTASTSGPIAGLAWLAGINHMRWRDFLFWNAAGGVAWALSVGLLAYALGPTAEKLFKTFGIAGAGLVIAILAGLFAWRHFRYGSPARPR